MDLARLVTVETYESVAQARLAQGRLEAAGIDAVLIDEYVVVMIPLPPTAPGGVKLQVREEDEQEALEILADPGVDPPASGNLCPRCDPDQASTGARSVRESRALRLLIGGSGRPAARRRKCPRCGEEWG